GDEDLYVSNLGSANRLYQNDGTGHFTDVAAAAGVAVTSSGATVAWGDYDNDGYVDLYVVDNMYCGFVYQPDYLFHNQGDGTFTDVAAAVGVDRPLQEAFIQSTTWGLGFADLDLDGWQDLFVSAGGLPPTQLQADELFMSDGAGAFLDLTAPSAMGDPSTGR